MRTNRRTRTSKNLSELSPLAAFGIRRRHRRTMHADADAKVAADGGDRITVEEIHIAIDGFTDVEFGRLKSAAELHSCICGVPADDLLQEAYTRALDGTRTCGRGTSIIAFICGVMKSLTSQDSEARKRGFRSVTVIKNGEPCLPDVAADIISPEQSAISAIDDVQTLAKVDALVADDEQRQLLIEAIDDGMRGAQLREFMNTDEKGLAALRKKLIRRLQAGFSDRITP